MSISEKVNNLLEYYKNKYNFNLIYIEETCSKHMLMLIDCFGYKYYVDYNVLRNCKNRNITPSKFFRNNIYTRDNILNYLKVNNKNFELISTNISNAKENLIWKCPIHGEFIMSWNCVSNGQGCPMCGQEKVASKRRNSYEYIKQEFEKRDLILISTEYKNNEQKLQYICNKHKDKGIQETRYSSLIYMDGCAFCSREKFSLKQTKSHEKFLEEVKEVHGDKYAVLDKYENCKKKVRVFCTECNKEFRIKPTHLIDGHGCANCSSSRGEKKISRFLDLNEISYIQQKRFEECKIKKKLPFDFYLPDYNLLIEYHGKQHYEPIDKFGGQEAYEMQMTRDNFKKEFCSKNDIKYLEIPYWNYAKINEILKENLLKEE